GLLLLSSGCGGKSGKLEGGVKLNGAAVTGGDIAFFDSKGTQITSSQISPTGKYAVDIPPGTYKVTFDTERIKSAGKGPAIPKGIPAELKDKMKTTDVP